MQDCQMRHETISQNERFVQRIYGVGVTLSLLMTAFGGILALLMSSTWDTREAVIELRAVVGEKMKTVDTLQVNSRQTNQSLINIQNQINELRNRP